MLCASNDSRAEGFMIKKFVSEHTCSRQWKVKALTANYLAEHYMEIFRDDEKTSLKSFARKVQKELHMTLSRSKLGRARRIALKAIHGDKVKQYNQLWDYATELRRSNPGSSFLLSLNSSFFETLYVSMDACKRVFSKVVGLLFA